MLAALNKVIAILALLVGMDSQALSREQIESLVLHHYPKPLVVEWRSETGLSDLELLPRSFEYLISDFNGDGTETIFVTYQNMHSVRVAMLDMEGNLLANHTALPEMKGHGVAIEALDFTGDGYGEIALLIQGGVSLKSRAKNYVIAWDGSEFSLLTPLVSEAGKTYSSIAGASYLDVDGDGVYEIYDERNSEVKTILRYLDNSFKPVSEVAIFSVFKSFQGRQEHLTEEFSIEDPSLEYRMFVFNGVELNKSAVTGSISINGIEILSGDTFNYLNRLIDVSPIELTSNNAIDIQAQGDPDTVITVIIERRLE